MEVGTYVGIDVAKANIDIAVRPGGRVWQASYDAAGIEELVSQLGDRCSASTILADLSSISFAGSPHRPQCASDGPRVRCRPQDSCNANAGLPGVLRPAVVQNQCGHTGL